MTGEEIDIPKAHRTVTKWEDGTNYRAANITEVWKELAHYVQEGDIVVNTFMKSGTTWMAQLILQMINNGEETLFAPDNTIHHVVPWIENLLRIQTKDDDILKKLNAARVPRDHRRIIKSHMQPEEVLFFFGPKVRYVCVFRDGRDVVLSLYNHTKSLTEEYLKRATYKGPEEGTLRASFHPVYTTTSGLSASTALLGIQIESSDAATRKNGAPTTILEIEMKTMNVVDVTKREFDDGKFVSDFDTLFETWLHGSNPPFWDSDYFHHLQSWFDHAHARDNNDILLVNYNEMQFDLTNVVSKLAKFLDIHVDATTSASFLNVLRHSSFEYMKQHEELFNPPSAIMKPGNFIHKGVGGRWRKVLTESQHQKYWDKIKQTWSAELIKFVHN